jgi:thiamine biosynthesis lipoprotein
MNPVSPSHFLPPDAMGLRCLDFQGLGTACQIKFREPRQHRALQFAADALDWIGKFEARFSRFRPDSMVSRINAAAGQGWVETDAETDQLLDIADGMFHLTEGIMDPTLLPLLRIWDWKALHERLPDPARVTQALQLTGWEKVERRPGAVRLPEAGMGLDFGGFGKELAVDALSKLAQNAGIADFLIDLGRDVFAQGSNGTHPFWHIGIEDGNAPGNCWGGLAINGRAVSSSGNYARKFTHHGISYGHILDPRTGWPVPRGMSAVTVVAPTCLEAGIYSTAVFVLGTRKGLALASRARGVAVCAQSEQGIDGTLDFGQWLVKAA